MYRNRPVVSHELTIFRSFDYLYVYKCDVLCDLVPFAQFTKNVKNTNGAVLLLVTLAFEQTTPKVAVFPVTFEQTTRSRFLNCTNGTKSRNVSQI